MLDYNERAYIDLTESSRLSYFELLYVKRCNHDSTRLDQIHTHPYAEFIFIEEGSGCFQFDMSTCPVKTGDFLIINPGTKYSEICTNGNSLKCIILGFLGLEIEHKENVPLEFTIIPARQNGPDYRLFFSMFFAEYKSKKENHLVICNLLLKAMLLYLMEEKVLINTTRSKPDKSSVAIRHYIDEHFKENMSLETLEEITGTTKFHIAHSFKRFYGISPIHYLQLKRISEGKKLLSETKLPIRSIAETLNYKSASHFCQCFKRLTTISPLEYRKLCQQIKEKR